MTKLSIIIPVYNVEKYLRRCLDSILRQSLSDIEIICVNDGSTDSSREILGEYACRDGRVRVIDKPNGGYGQSMNIGLDAAEGEYIGIVESDDWAEPDMFERLYTSAKENSLDVCKGGFFYYFSLPEERDNPCPVGDPALRGRVFSPTEDIKSLSEQIKFFNIKPTVWSAIYRRDFLREANIRFTETAGASFQDTAFNFKVWALARRVMLLDGCFLHYRQDNEASSVNSTGKVYCVCDEYREIESFLASHPELGERMRAVKGAIKLETYLWNYERLAEGVALEFLLAASEELARDMQAGECPRGAYSRGRWNNLHFIISNPTGYHRLRQAEKAGEVTVSEGEDRGSILKRALRCIRERGIFYTARRAVLRTVRMLRRR